MKRKVLEKVINLIREEMMAAGTGGFSASADSKKGKKSTKKNKKSDN